MDNIDGFFTYMEFQIGVFLRSFLKDHNIAGRFGIYI